jgi:hypothetical protein
LLGCEDELADYYRRLIAIAETHNKQASLRHPFPYFRTQPVIIVGDEVLTEFLWNDDLHETRTVLEVLVVAGDSADGSLWEDQDQCWCIQIAAAGALTCFIEWNAEGPRPRTGGYMVDAASIARQAAAALDRLHIIHGRLVQALGQDYWSYTPPSYTRPSYAPPMGRIRSVIARFLTSIKNAHLR